MPLAVFQASFRSLALVLAAALLFPACAARNNGDELPLCERCHGGNGSAAPPRTVHGATETTVRGVGAHRQHLEAGPVRGPIECRECHIVPGPTPEDNPSGHIGDGVTVTFGGPLGRARGAAPEWDAATETCSNVYCHGGRAGGGNAGGANMTPQWTLVDGTQRQCGSCHGYPPMPSHAGRGPSCSGCHGLTVGPDNVTIDVQGGHHINGIVDGGGGPCGSCHAIPPATGAHLAHATFVQPTDTSYGSLATYEDLAPIAQGTTYAFGCGHCHPVDEAMHMNGTVDVVLTPPGAPASDHDLKARNAPNAAYDCGAHACPPNTTGGCNGVYCHSSGQTSPAYRTTPVWTSAPGTLGCNGCHDDPPRYDSGGPGAANANSHVNLDVDDWQCAGGACTVGGVPADRAWEFGHFSGMPGPDHSTKHGGGAWPPGQRASPITCQACHFDTVDPTNLRTGSSFFYYDTSGDYSLLPDGLAGRDASSAWRASQCGTCHGPGGALADSAGPGRVLPLRHVNGVRDVAFDRRTALPIGYDIGVSVTGPDPIRPYYYTGNGVTTERVTFSSDVALDVALRTTATGGTLVTMTLEHAQYDPATKTCSSVSCHLGRQYEVDTGSESPLRWGESYVAGSAATCNGCHPNY